MSEYHKIYHKNNREKMIEASKRRYHENLEVNREKAREYGKINREARIKYGQSYYLNNSELVKAKVREYYYKTIEYQRERKEEYYVINKETILARNQKNLTKRLREDPQFKFKRTMRSRIQSAFKSYSINGKAMTSKEYGINFFEIYNKLGPRPSSNHHLDHIIPLHLFNYDNKEHVRLSNLPCNLRWTTKEDNLRKSGRLVDLVFETPELLQIYNEITKKVD
jgi:hypothetical protein